MKRRNIILSLALALTLTGCGHEHNFSEATCESPKICTECGEIEGTALEHNWLEATTENPKTCSICGLTEGKALEVPEESEATIETPTEAAPDSGVDSAGTSVTLEPDEYKGDDNYETNTPEEQAQIDAELVEMFKEDLENGVITEEDYNLIIEGMFSEPVQESTPSVNVTKIGPGATVTDGIETGAPQYGEVDLDSAPRNQSLAGYRID